MDIPIEIVPAKREAWYTPDEAARFYGRARTFEEIVLHHWDTPQNRPAFQSNLAYLTNPPNDVPSANCIIGYDESLDRVRIVDSVLYPNVAFTSSGPTPASRKNERAKYINCVSLAIEIDPLIETNSQHRDEIIDAVGLRVYLWRKQAGKNLPLTGHSDYVYTDCPGNMPFSEIEKSAQRWAKEETPMDRGTVYNFYREAFRRDPSEEEYKTWVGKSFQELFYAGGKAQYKWLWDQLEATQKALADANADTLVDPRYIEFAIATEKLLKG